MKTSIRKIQKRQDFIAKSMVGTELVVNLGGNGIKGILTMLQYGKHLKKYSRRLRSEMTDAERLLWSKIRGKQLKGFQVYRQKPIGRFVVDFYCPKAKLVIELDGGQHYSEAILAKDESRDRYVERVGLKVLRFSDKEVFENLPGVQEIGNRL